MVRSIWTSVGFGILGLMLALPGANAQLGRPWNQPYIGQQQQAEMVWEDMRECAQAANRSFPDHTPEADQKRENARLNCLRIYHLPVDPRPVHNYSPPR